MERPSTGQTSNFLQTSAALQMKQSKVTIKKGAPVGAPFVL
jgi:hypothetical protein